jgi:hypothetical protein
VLKIVEKIGQVRSLITFGSRKVTWQCFAAVIIALIRRSIPSIAHVVVVIAMIVQLLIIMMPCVNVVINLLHSNVLEGFLQCTLSIFVESWVHNKNVRLAALIFDMIVFYVIDILGWLYALINVYVR